jgi:anti-sigma28 factor (negative regulator of flagellin synthesis)
MQSTKALQPAPASADTGDATSITEHDTPPEISDRAADFGVNPVTGSPSNDKEIEAADLKLDRVKKIQEALADGTYYVSATDVARKLMSHLLEK